MNFNFADYGTWLAGAAIVVGIIQWIKNILTSIFKKLEIPSWVFSLLVPLVSLGVGLSYGHDKWVWNALGIWAIAQVEYELIVRSVIKKIDSTNPTQVG